MLERIFRKLKIFKNITYPSKKQVQGIQEIVLEPEIKYDWEFANMADDIPTNMEQEGDHSTETTENPTNQIDIIDDD